MENASKALIIAGAILIAILLIGVGVMVMRGASAPIEQATDMATSQAIEMYNTKFTGFAGIQKASSVKALMTSVISTNAANANNKIELTWGTPTTNDTPEGIQAKVNNQKNYKVTIDYAATDVTETPTTAAKIKGYVSKINITEQ